MTKPQDQKAAAARSAIASLQNYLHEQSDDSQTAAIRELFNALSQLTGNPAAQQPRYALVELPDGDTSYLGGPRFYGGANPRFYLQADADGEIIDRDGVEYGQPAEVRALAAALLAVADYASADWRRTATGRSGNQPGGEHES